MKITLWVVGILAVLVGVFYAFNSYIYNEKQGEEGALPSNYQEVTFTISGKPVTLVDGYAEEESAPGSSSKTVTRYFGNHVEGDFSGDGVSDIAFLITQEGGGSGTFFFLVGAIKTDEGYRGTQAVLIGDRIAPQTTEFEVLPEPFGARIIVNYAERAPGEPMTASPSVGKSLYLKYSPDSNDFGEVVQNFEGESA